MQNDVKLPPAPNEQWPPDEHLRKQIRALRRKGLTLADHAYALDLQPSNPRYTALANLWSEMPQ